MSSDHENKNSISNSTVDAKDYLKIVPNPDGTITRLFQFPSTPTAPDPTTNLSPVLTKDVPLNPTRHTWIRIFLPSQAMQNHPTTKKLPLVVYYHGGGFILLSASSCMNHDFCSKMAAEFAAVVVSVDYRLAPEHRLPAAYEDAVEALHWMKSAEETWLREFCDVSSCFLMGTSAGGNITYHAGLRASSAVDELAPLKIRGLILHHPFFGGVRRTASEVRLANNPILPLSGSDLMWELALPIGVDRDHGYCNPKDDDKSCENFDRIRVMGWPVLVIGCDGDPLIDRQVEFVETLKKKGVAVVAQFHQGDYHGVELMELSKAKELFVLVKDFIQCNN
ncbi:carboxylesterase 1-like [Morus notabilis]|uniref:carboxylesterase 1-like n=1 Tax=Morus notabilis TaxID=981085 RepID=UPI000CED3A67|nr:carboxylesterase 1-like [Morus notabilis]